MQLAVMARRAAATGIRASQGYLPTAQYQSVIPIQNSNQYASGQVYQPSALSVQAQPSEPTAHSNWQNLRQLPSQISASVSPVDSELSDEAKGAHLALSGALSAFHGAALPQASVHVPQNQNSISSAQLNAPLTSFHDKLFSIFTAPDSNGASGSAAGFDELKSLAARKKAANVVESRKSALRAFHDRMFQVFTAPTMADAPKQPNSLSPQTVDNIISTDRPHAAAPKSSLSAFHDHLFQLFTSPTPSDATQAVGQLQTDSNILSRDAQRLTEVHLAAQRKAKSASAASMADKGFYSVWHDGAAAKARPAQPALVDEGRL